MIDQRNRIHIAPGAREKSIKWYRDNVRALSAVSASEFGKLNTKVSGSVVPGRMYLFSYDPKYKATLPIYDRMPLVIPFEFVPGGFMGINLHYLPVPIRYQVLGALVKTHLDNKLSQDTKVAITWDLIKKTSKLKPAQYAVKRYLRSHVRSDFLQIPYASWDMAVSLPTENFVFKK